MYAQLLGDPSFTEALCSSPPLFDDNTITAWPTGRTFSDTVYQYDNVVTYTCNAGYYVEPGSWAFASSCTRYGTWSDLVDRCTRTFRSLYMYMYSCLCTAVHVRLDCCLRTLVLQLYTYTYPVRLDRTCTRTVRLDLGVQMHGVLRCFRTISC